MVGSAPRRGVGATRSRAAGQAGGRGREKASEPVCSGAAGPRRRRGGRAVAARAFGRSVGAQTSVRRV